MADALVVPGGNFGPAAGMLMYAGDVAERRGATVHRHTWSSLPRRALEPPVETWVRDQIAPVLDSLHGTPLLIGKSLGTNAARLAAERGLPAVWLTPLLTAEWVADAMAEATAPFLLVGGTADRWWDGRIAGELSPHVLEVEGADHGMQVSGPLGDTIAVLGRVLDAMDDFLTAIDWPERP